MVDAWPSDLPQKFQVQQFTEGVGDGLLEYAPDVGPSISRRRTAAVMRPMSGAMICTADQIAIFRTFYEVTILGGSLPFNFPDQIRAGTLLVKFTKQSPPTWPAISGRYFNLTLVLVVLP
jgi:hypothetical protein